MPALDTNVLVRYLVKDDPNQHAATIHIMESITESNSLFISLTVALELEWVLRSCYKVDKTAIIDTYTSLLETTDLEFQEESSIERALSLFGEYSVDFADCLHLAISMTNERKPLVTFDKKAAKLPDAELLHSQRGT